MNPLTQYATLIKWGTGVVLFVGYTIFVGWMWGGHVTAKYEKAISAQKIAAAKELSDAWKEVSANDAHNSWITSELEIKDEKLVQAGKDKEVWVRAAITNAGGLRDPGRRPSSENTGKDGAGATVTAACPTDDGRLSGEFSEFLIGQNSKANTLRDTVAICHSYALEVEAFNKRVREDNAKIK